MGTAHQAPVKPRVYSPWLVISKGTSASSSSTKVLRTIHFGLQLLMCQRNLSSFWRMWMRFFSVHHETTESSSLSFSGFLNALDGLGAPDDVIFILTTNFPERLDPAVRRPGRIDLHVSFHAPSREMAAEYFSVFYPDAPEASKAFAASTGERLRGGDLSMAQLQHFFLDCHRRGLEAVAAAELVKNYHFENVGNNSGSSMIS